MTVHEISMRRLPHRYTPFLFGVAQACVTTGLATAIATQDTTPFGLLFLERWLGSWAVSWALVVPVVLLAAPMIKRTAAALTEPGPGRRSRRALMGSPKPAQAA